MSHAWTYPFADLLAALEAHFERSASDGKTAYLWVGACSPCGRARRKLLTQCNASDIFVGNQHRAAQLPQSWWTQTFRQSVIDIGRTVLVLQPWDAPVPLTRSWCLWEIFSTLDGGVELQIALSPAQREAFQQALVRGVCLRCPFAALTSAVSHLSG